MNVRDEVSSRMMELRPLSPLYPPKIGEGKSELRHVREANDGNGNGKAQTWSQFTIISPTNHSNTMSRMKFVVDRKAAQTDR